MSEPIVIDLVWPNPLSPEQGSFHLVQRLFDVYSKGHKSATVVFRIDGLELKTRIQLVDAKEIPKDQTLERMRRFRNGEEPT